MMGGGFPEQMTWNLRKIKIQDYFCSVGKRIYDSQEFEVDTVERQRLCPQSAFTFLIPPSLPSNFPARPQAPRTPS